MESAGGEVELGKDVIEPVSEMKVGRSKAEKGGREAGTRTRKWGKGIIVEGRSASESRVGKAEAREIKVQDIAPG